MKYCLLLCLFLFSCGTTRKLSQVELRTPASMPEKFSTLRAKVVGYQKYSAKCPAEISLFAFLASDQVIFPPCPSDFPANIQNTLHFLKLEERTTLEEVLNSHCRSFAKGQFADSLENLYLNFDTSGPLGRRRRVSQTVASMENDFQILAGLKKEIGSIVAFSLPLDRWVSKNGEFVLPEEDLKSLDKLLVEHSCQVTEGQIDEAFQAIRALEDLTHILGEGDQKIKVERFLDGIHKIIDQKVREYF